MRPPRRTPYLRSPATELREVHDLLYSPRTEDKRAGLNRVALWLNRSSCPYAVENTAAIIEALLLEQAAGSRSESMASRLCLNMAIVRFVNSLVDSHQTGMFAVPVKTIAMRVGLPLWLVELRHAGTHDELPSLEALRTASKLALQWLDANFWRPSIAETQRTAAPAEAPPTPMEEEQEEEETNLLEGFPEPTKSTGFESVLDAMRRRIEEAERLKRDGAGGNLNTRSKDDAQEGMTSGLTAGWRIAGPDWVPTPIGMLNGKVPELDL